MTQVPQLPPRDNANTEQMVINSQSNFVFCLIFAVLEAADARWGAGEPAMSSLRDCAGAFTLQDWAWLTWGCSFTVGFICQEAAGLSPHAGTK